MVSFSLISPYQPERRDILKCDVVCNGHMLSLMSGLKLASSPLLGHLSDKCGRKVALYISYSGAAVSFILFGLSETLLGLWLSVIPGAIFNHAFSIIKALVSDFTVSNDERASAHGTVGMAAGLGMIIGPAINMLLIRSYQQAAFASTICCILGMLLVTLLPLKTATTVDPCAHSDSAIFKAALIQSFRSHIQSLSSTNSSTLVMVLLRFCASLAFWIFHTTFSVSLRDRFGITARGQSFVMAYIGLIYALSQHFVAKPVVRRYSKDGPVTPFVICICGLAVGRLVCFMASEYPLVVVSLGMVVVALGVFNTILSAAISKAVDADSVGRTFGILQAVENMTGVFGPTLGGYLGALNPFAPIIAIQFIYGIMVMVILTLYRIYVSPALQNDKAKVE